MTSKADNVLNFQVSLFFFLMNVVYLNDDIAVAGDILAPPLTAVLHHLLAAPVLARVHTLYILT